MTRKHFIVYLTAIFTCQFHCSNTPNPTGPENIRLVITNTCDTNTRVFFNTEDQGDLQPGESRLFKLPTGNLSITFRDALLQRTFEVDIRRDTSMLTCAE